MWGEKKLQPISLKLIPFNPLERKLCSYQPTSHGKDFLFVLKTEFLRTSVEIWSSVTFTSNFAVSPMFRFSKFCTIPFAEEKPPLEYEKLKENVKKKDEAIFVFDLGVGTFDVSLLYF